MKLNQVLVVYKQVSASFSGKIGGGSSLHLATLNRLYEVLKSFGIPFGVKSTRQLKNVVNADLVITLGGDGTVLYTSHFVHNSPILGIKSFGRQSVGYFCAATGETMKGYIRSLKEGKKKPIKLHRLQVLINGQKLDELALNDVLFTNVLPASTSKYRLTIGGKTEEQKSSGVWVSTAAGSTAAVRAAGGKVLPLTSDKIEYLVREPYFYTKKYRFKRGVLSSNAAVRIASSMQHGTIFIDGGSTQYPAPMGSTITIRSAKKPLSVYWR
ncbi:MAG: NAD(+) kinase [Deltaproteobacteria bacterium CG11_big_fil_rev_8_21_14_0_20_49_13]|nr:MAG: NAD(+) kinase [Deltaproteobacteria bacterium CG11_big_fil_rev_8_21_14_0_20_49_13]